MQGWPCVPAKVSVAKRMMDWWGNGKTQAHSGGLPRQWSMYLHIINVMRGLEPPSLDVSFSTYLVCTNYQAGLFPGIETKKKMLIATPLTVYTIDRTNVSLGCSQALLFPLLIAGTAKIASVGGWWLLPSRCGGGAWTGSSSPVILVVAQCVSLVVFFFFF